MTDHATCVPLREHLEALAHSREEALAKALELKAQGDDRVQTVERDYRKTLDSSMQTELKELRLWKANITGRVVVAAAVWHLGAAVVIGWLIQRIIK